MTSPLIGLIVAGYVVLRCFEIWAVNPNHWNSPKLGYFVKFWAGLTCLGTTFLAFSLFDGTDSVIAGFSEALRSRATLQAIFIAVLFGMIGYGYLRTRRFRMKKLVARLHRQTVLDGIDLSRSLM